MMTPLPDFRTLTRSGKTRGGWGRRSELSGRKCTMGFGQDFEGAQTRRVVEDLRGGDDFVGPGLREDRLQALEDRPERADHGYPGHAFGVCTLGRAPAPVHALHRRGELTRGPADEV